MEYAHSAIVEIPQASEPVFQHLLDTYASEINKVVSIWLAFRDEDLAFRPHPRSMSVEQVMKHQLLSERRFFGEFLATPEPPAAEVLPQASTPAAYAGRLCELVLPRLAFFAAQNQTWWLAKAQFFDVQRERIWIFWRRMLHTAHHRTQLAVNLRLLEKPVPPIYGPTADVKWAGADPTTTVEAAGRS